MTKSKEIPKCKFIEINIDGEWICGLDYEVCNGDCIQDLVDDQLPNCGIEFNRLLCKDFV
jgi:hypothetical protein